MFELIELLAAAKPTRVVSIDWMAENHPEILEDALKRAAEKREHAKREVAEAKKQLMKALEDAKKAREEKLLNLKGIDADIEGMEAELKRPQ